MFGEASCMEENSHDFVEVLERSTRTADGTLYDQEDVQDVQDVLIYIPDSIPESHARPRLL